MCANSEGSGETARMRRLAWAFAGRLCDKYHNLMNARSNASLDSDKGWSIHYSSVWQFEPSHEIMVLFVLRKRILQTCMCSHLVGLDVWFLVGPFVYFQTSCVQTVKALARLRGCAGSPEPSLVAYVISTIISWAWSIVMLGTNQCFSTVLLKRIQSSYQSIHLSDFPSAFKFPYKVLICCTQIH